MKVVRTLQQRNWFKRKGRQPDSDPMRWRKGGSAERHTRAVVSLNLGGRNLNPFEFVLEGDDSEVGQRATELRLRAQAAVVDVEHGPKAMEPAEVVVLADSFHFSVFV